jgi:hypothetical protein
MSPLVLRLEMSRFAISRFTDARNRESLPPVSGEVKNMRIYAATPSYAFMVQCLIS